jgi:hypothetical protein
LPLFGLAAESMNEDNGALGALGRDINCRKADEGIGGNANFVTIKVEVYVHLRSLHEAGANVNLRKPCDIFMPQGFRHQCVGV